MNRRTLVFALMLSLTFASSHLLAKTVSIASSDDNVAPTTENVGGDAETQPPRKPADKRAEPNAPAKAKPQTQYRDQQINKAAPRWHRFIPGMIR